MEKTPWGKVLLFVGAGIVAAFQVGKAPPVLPLIRADFGMSLFLAGWILSIFTFIGILLGPVAGAVADAFGHRRLLITGMVLQAFGSLIGSFSPNALLLLTTRGLEGVGFFIVVVSAPALVVRVTNPRDMRLSLSIWSCFLPTGASAIMLLTPLLMAKFGWRGVWQVNALILAGYVRLFTKLTASAVEDQQNSIPIAAVWQDVVRTATSLGPILLATIFATYTLQWLAVMGFLPTLLIEGYRFNPGQASVLTAIMVAMNVPGNLTGGWLLQKGFLRWRLIAGSSLVMGLCGIFIYAADLSFPVRYGACLLFSGVGGLLPSSVLGGAPVHAPTPKLVATTNGLIMQGSQLGQTIGPPALAAIVSSSGSWQSAPWLLGSAAALGILLAFFLGAVGRIKEAGA